MQTAKNKKTPLTDAQREHNTINWFLEQHIHEDFTANEWLEIIALLLEQGHDHLHDWQLKSIFRMMGFINHMQLVKQKMMLEKIPELV